MKNKKDKKLIILMPLALLLLIGIFALFYFPNYKIDEGEPTDVDGANYCTAQAREASFCLELYRPVCGWKNSTRIQCIKYPCAQTYSNDCFACKDQDVAYWTSGECPK